MKNENGITLIALAITIAVLTILTFTLTINVNGYKEKTIRTKFETDLKELKEEIDQYYVRNKALPYFEIDQNTKLKFDKNVLVNKIGDYINVNDNDNYYIIDLTKLNLNLNYGNDFDQIETEEITNETITDDTLDIYIINEQSHTIYYPKGMEYEGKTCFRSVEEYSEIENIEVNELF